MKNAKRIVALILCFALLVSAMAVFVSAAETEPATEQTTNTETTQSQAKEPSYTVEWPTASDVHTAITNAVISPLQIEGWETIVEASSFLEGEYGVYTYGDNQFISMDKIDGSASNAYANMYAGKGRSSHKPGEGWYTIVQFDSAYLGKLSGTTNPLFRDKNGPNAYGINNTNLYGGFEEGEVIQFTFIFYAVTTDGTTKGYNDIYRNGELYASGLGGITIDAATAYSDVLRLYFNECFIVYDNIYVSYSQTHPVVNGVIADEYNQFNKAEYKKLVLPPVATINGVEYSTVSDMTNALVHNSEVEFLAPPMTSDDKFVVNSTSVINTNGFVTAEDIDLSRATSYTVDGNVITAIVPNYSSATLTDNSTGAGKAASAVTSPVTGTAGTTVSFANNGAGKYMLYTANGNSFITVAKDGSDDSYAQFKPNKTYYVTTYPYFVMQYDAAYLGAKPTGSMRPTVQLPATNAPIIYNETLFKNMNPGEVAQFTFVFYATQNADNPDTADVNESNTGTSGCYVYRNGEYLTNATGWKITNWSTAYLNQLRGYQTASCPIAIDNVYAMYFAADPRLEGTDGKFDFGQYENGNFVSYSQFNDSAYTKLEMPAIATVNGVEYNTVHELNAALAACNTTAEVEFLHDYIEGPSGIAGKKIAVKCNAVINTNGFITAEDLELIGNYSVDGNVIRTVYWETAGSVTSNQLNAILNSPVTTNKGVSSGVNSDYTFTRYITASDRELVSVKKNTGSGTVNFSFTTSYFKNTSYTMVQFESGYLGTLGSDAVTILYNAGGGNSGSSYGNSVIYKDMKPGEIAQFTFVFYAGEASIGLAIYRNGKLLYNEPYKINVTDPTAYRISGFRITSGATEALYSNMYVYHTNEDPRVLNIDGRYTFGEYDQFSSEEFVSAIPAFATVNGVDYNNVDHLNAELAKYYELPAEVEFLYDKSLALWGGRDKIVVDRSATIDTNGFVTADDLTLPAFYTVEGDIITARRANNKGTIASSSNAFSTVVKSDIAGNMYTNSINANKSWDIVTAPDGNKYIDFHTTGSDFKIQMDLAPETGKGDFNDYPTFIVQYELIKTGEISSGMNQTILIRTGDSGYSYTGAMTLSEMLKDVEYGELAQVSIVMHADSSNNTAYIRAYVNGVLKYNGAKTYTKEQFDSSRWYAFRMLYCEVTDVDENGDGKKEYSLPKMGANVLFDNAYTCSFAAGTEGIFDKDYKITDDYSQFARPDHKSITLAPVALVDGEAYGYDTIDAIVTDGGEHEIDLLHKPFGNLAVRAYATVKTNGYKDCIIAGTDYVLGTPEANGVIAVMKDNRILNLDINFNGGYLFTIEDVAYNNNHEAIIRDFKFDDNALHSNSVYYTNGKYYELVWDFTKPEYTQGMEKITYNVTLADAKPILVVNTNTNKVVNNQLTFTSGVLTAGISTSYPATFYFNEDITSTTHLPNNLTLNQMVWELNGHTYQFNGTGDTHALIVDTKDEIVINNGTFIGNGGGSLIMGTTSTSSLTFNNVTITSNTTTVDWRAGVLNFNNCTFDNIHMSIGTRIPGEAYVNFDGCTIVSRAFTPFGFYNNASNPAFGFADGSCTNYARHITVKNSTIKVPDGALVSMPHDKTIKLEEGEKNNVALFVENSTIYAGYAYANEGISGTIVFGDGVKYAINDAASLDKVTAAENVALGVKTNDIAAYFVATSKYATVNWASGLVELWEDGAIPVASSSADKNYKVRAVVAGETFDVTEATDNDYILRANLTLHANIYFNIYVENATSVTINGVLLKGVPTADGETRYSYELLPASAFGDIYIAITFADGSVYTRTTSLMEYVNKSTENHSSETDLNKATVQMYANMVRYLLDVQNYEYVIFAQTDANAYVAAHAPVAAPTVDAVVSDNIGEYFTSATFQLDGEVWLVLKGANLNDVTVKVGDYTATTHVADGKLYVMLPAYLLTDAIEITVGDATVQYSLGAYVNATTGKAQLAAKSLYNYAYAAELYEAAYEAAHQ